MGRSPPRIIVGPPTKTPVKQPKTPAEGLAAYAKRTGTYLIDPGMPSYKPGEYVGPEGRAVSARTPEEARQALEQQKTLREQQERAAFEKRVAERAEEYRRELEAKKQEYREVSEAEYTPSPYRPGYKPEEPAHGEAEIRAYQEPSAYEKAVSGAHRLREKISTGVQRLQTFVGRAPGEKLVSFKKDTEKATLGLREYVGAEVKPTKGALTHTGQMIRHHPKAFVKQSGQELKEIGEYAWEHPVETGATIAVIAGAGAVAPTATMGVLGVSVAHSFIHKPERGVAEVALLGAGALLGKGAGKLRRKAKLKVTPFEGEARLKDTELIAGWGKSVVRQGKVTILSETKSVSEVLSMGKGKVGVRTKGVITQITTRPGKPPQVELLGTKTHAAVTETGVKGLSTFIGKSKVKTGTKIEELTIAGKAKEIGKRTTPKGVRAEQAIISAATPDIVTPPELRVVPELPSAFGRMKHVGRKKPPVKKRVETDYGFELSEVSAGAVSFKTPKKLGVPFRIGEAKPKPTLSFDSVPGRRANLFYKLKKQRGGKAKGLEIETPKPKSKNIFKVARAQRETKMFSWLDSVSPKPSIKSGPLKITSAPGTRVAAMSFEVEPGVAFYDKPVPSMTPMIAERLAIAKIGRISQPAGPKIAILSGEKTGQAQREKQLEIQDQRPGGIRLTSQRDILKPKKTPGITAIPRIAIKQKSRQVTAPKITTEQIEKLKPLEIQKEKPGIKQKAQPKKQVTLPATPKRPPRTQKGFLYLSRGRIPRGTGRPRARLPKARKPKGGLYPLADPLSMTITEARTFRKARHQKPTKKVKKAFALELMRRPGMVRFPTFEMKRKKGGLKI